jgi:hypothetical protein
LLEDVIPVELLRKVYLMIKAERCRGLKTTLFDEDSYTAAGEFVSIKFHLTAYHF